MDVNELLQKNEGFSVTTESSNGKELNTYFIQGGKMYRKRSGRISFADTDYGSTSECDLATVKRILTRYEYKLNK